MEPGAAEMFFTHLDHELVLHMVNQMLSEMPFPRTALKQ